MTVRRKGKRNERDAPGAITEPEEAEKAQMALWTELKRVGGLAEERKRRERNALARLLRRKSANKRRSAGLPVEGMASELASSKSPTGGPQKRSWATAIKPKKVAKNYRRPAENRLERLRRHLEQRHIARQNGLDWRKLTFSERRKRIRFGTNAWCRDASDVRALARITGKIAHGREKAAVSNWALDPSQQAAFSAICGFKQPTDLIASNKLVRIDAAYSLTKMMLRLYNTRRNLHFYFVTFINDAWHSRHDQTNIDLDGVHRAIATSLRLSGLNWLGMIEIDIFNNYPGKGQGLWIAPHGHVFIWSPKPIKPRKLASQLARMGDFSSSLTDKPVVVKRIRSERDIAHLCFYINKPNYQCKAVGRENLKTGKASVYTVEKAVRPAYTLRIAEILSYCSFQDLIVSGGHGIELGRKWIRSLRGRQEQLEGGPLTSPEPAAFWDSLKPGRSTAAPIQVVKPSRRARMLPAFRSYVRRGPFRSL